MQKLYKINIEGEEYTVGYPASVLVGQLEEELETLRAENAKLFADRESAQIQADHFRNLLLERAKERDALLAEREAMMKQEPSALVTFTFVDEDTGQTVYHVSVTKPLNKGDLLYAQPLPAQQIPEGYANDSKRLDFMISKEAYIGWSRDGEKCALYSNDADEENTLQRLNGYTCFNDPREAIDSAMLSASQPKGDV